jgi:hypothetical protein
MVLLDPDLLSVMEIVVTSTIRMSARLVAKAAGTNQGDVSEADYDGDAWRRGLMMSTARRKLI